MPKDLYRWHEGGALVHHCPVCHIPLSADKARTTCLGKHVEWCSLYHTQLFKKGHSRECMACCKSEKERAKRHREIAELVRQVKDTPASNPDEATPRKGWVKPDKSLTKEERKAKKKAAKRAEKPMLVATQFEVDAVTLALCGPEPDEEDEERSLLEDVTIQENLFFHRGTSNTKELRMDMIVKPRESAAERPSEPGEAEIDVLVKSLGVGGEAKGKVVDKIREAVRENCKIAENERRDAMMRKGGFWRWASRKAYLRLVENGRCWDEKEDIDRRDSIVDSVADEDDGEEEEDDDEGEDVPQTPKTPIKENFGPAVSNSEKGLKKGETLVLCGNGGLRKLSISVEKHRARFSLPPQLADGN